MERIGRLVNGNWVLCPECAVGGQGVPLFRDNIDRYGQDCHECGKVIVTAKPGWPVLFMKPISRPAELQDGPDIDCGPVTRDLTRNPITRREREGFSVEHYRSA